MALRPTSTSLRPAGAMSSSAAIRPPCRAHQAAAFATNSRCDTHGWGEIAMQVPRWVANVLCAASKVLDG
jgi:hypothetical protein